MRVAIIGGGTIARLFLEHIKRGDLGAAGVVAIAGQPGTFAWQIFDAKVERLLRGEYGIRHGQCISVCCLAAQSRLT